MTTPPAGSTATAVGPQTPPSPAGGGDAIAKPGSAEPPAAKPVAQDAVNLTIDGIPVSVPKGTLIIRAAEQVGVHRDPGLLHGDQVVDQRQLHVGQESGAAVLLDLLVERLGEIEHRARVQHGGLGRAARAVVDAVEGELVALALPKLN